MADTLWSSFNRMFVDKVDMVVYDHLDADGTPDRQYRLNMLYALGMVADSALVMKETRDAWQRLVYPWGVASLDQNDAQFHPYHENWHHYHKDDAYHNGTVWLWNNGMAMQRMIEAGQQDIAWTLFENMNRQALFQGAPWAVFPRMPTHGPRKRHIVGPTPAHSYKGGATPNISGCGIRISSASAPVC